MNCISYVKQGDLLKLINIGILIQKIRVVGMRIDFLITLCDMLKIPSSTCARSIERDADAQMIFLQHQAFCSASPLCWGNAMLHTVAVAVEAVLNCVSWVEYRWHPWHYSKEITESDIRNPIEVEGNGEEMAPCRPSRPLCVCVCVCASYPSNLNVSFVSLSLAGCQVDQLT